jgi:hypothetical protein
MSDDGAYVVYAPNRETFWGYTDPPTQLIRWNRVTDERQVIVTVPEGQSLSGGPISSDAHTITYRIDDQNFRWRNGQSEALPKGQIRAVADDGDSIIYEADRYIGDPAPADILRWRNGRSQKITQGEFRGLSDDGNTFLLMTATPDGSALKDLAVWSRGTLTVLGPEPANGRLSGDGRVAVWWQQESEDPNGPSVVYRKKVGEEPVRIIRYPTASYISSFAISEDGSRITFVQGGGIYLR